MITLGSFLGALLAQMAKARAISDEASLQIAEHYLQHELLKGFPLPRMQFRDVEVEVHFAIASKLQGAYFLEDDEVQKNIKYQMREFLSILPNHRDFRSYFGKNTELATRWRGGMDDMAQRFAQILSKPAADPAIVIHSLSLSVQNYFHESAPEDLRPNVSSLLTHSLRKQPPEPDCMQAIIESKIRTIVTSMDRTKAVPDLDVPLNLSVLVGSAELEKLNPSVLDRIKVTANPADRRWVVSDQEGKKVYILGT